MTMKPLSPREKEMACSPLSHQLSTGVPRATLWNRTMLYICLHRCSHTNPGSSKHSTSQVLPFSSDGGPTQSFTSTPSWKKGEVKICNYFTTLVLLVCFQYSKTQTQKIVYENDQVKPLTGFRQVR